MWRCVKSKDRRGDKSSWKCFNLSEPLFLIVRWFRLQSQILFPALDIWSTAAKCAVLRSFALLFPSDLTQFTSHSAIREINNILTLHCCIYSLLPAGTWFLMKNFPETERNGCSLLTHRRLCVNCRTRAVAASQWDGHPKKLSVKQSKVWALKKCTLGAGLQWKAKDFGISGVVVYTVMCLFDVDDVL